MSRSSSKAETIRTYLVLAIVFLVALLFTNIIIGPVIFVLFYFFWYYYRRAKYLERKLAEVGTTPRDESSSMPRPDESPPISTDA